MSIERISDDSLNNDGLTIRSLPKTALQAIYHAATGKTENLSKGLSGNVVIKHSDFDRLYRMLIDQTDIYEQVIAPVVTVVVKNANDKTVTYSSWERFLALQVNNHDITSDAVIKIEFVLKLPNTAVSQRCVINIDLDSSLPIIDRGSKNSSNDDGFGFFILFAQREWKTVQISIDFVDFLVAKAFVNITEEWFSSLEKTPTSKLNESLLSKYEVIRGCLSQSGRIGIAIFLIGYIYFSGSQSESLSRLVYAISVGLLIWAGFSIFDSYISKLLFRRIYKNVIPTVILISEGDNSSYKKITENLNSPSNTIIIFCITIIINILLNVIASYIYAYLSSPRSISMIGGGPFYG
ncbi:hypothetical protein [Bosea sp. (in: a-proteobacteria)]|uniref:hypothetical protein n=1 Tax=Bosea sp. (in: a-proteobacteria) TaxID=1871050 RepID=UPI002B47D873|nr:hypothetical protein [Bosea sp. (in: a-proteobacteria)]WRH56046.1 MAG: hypothetical protein RSE11_13380 [Bosea sp. (in: a-proteobacteria)]